MIDVVIDLETDGLLDELTKVHCISYLPLESGGILEPFLLEPGELDSFPEVLQELEEKHGRVRLVGHNLLGFDLPVLERFYGELDVEVFDTLVAARMLYPDSSTISDGNIPADIKKNCSFHSLERWGHRLKILKGAYSKQTDWQEYDEEMGEYCVQDVRVTQALYAAVEGKIPDEALMLEQAFAEELEDMMQRGVYIDPDASAALHSEIEYQLDLAQAECRDLFPPRKVVTVSPKKQIRKEKLIPFNPGSRIQIAENLKALGWKPKEFTPTGRPKVDENILESLPYPQAKKLARVMMLQKRASQLYDTDNAILPQVKIDNRLYGRIRHIGTVTHRCSHSGPNLGQVPSVRKPYGKDFRGLFVPGIEGWKFVGCDASGLELRVAAHYMQPFDGGAYIDHVLHGDIHTVNMEALGITDRDLAKTFFYALVYGAGNAKLGRILTGKDNKKVGKEYRERLLSGVKGFKELVQAVKSKAEETGRVKLIDGRTVPVRSSHSALNTLFQGSGAVLMKKATVLLPEFAPEPPYSRMNPDGRWGMVLHVHDEFQCEAHADIAECLGESAVESIREAGVRLGSRCPLDGEAKIGNSWKETH